MNNNFTNQNPFKGHYPDLLKNYSDMVNQPTPTDSLADSFNKQAEGMSSTGAMNQAAKGVLGSIGASLKGTAAAERQEKLSPYLEMAGQITAKAAELEAQNQQEEARKNNGTNLVRSQMSLITSLGNSTAAGDLPAATGQARALGDAFQKAFGIDLGEFDSYDLNTRRIFYRNEDGTVTGYNIADELREYTQSAFGEQAPYIMQKFDPYYKDVYENTEQLKKLELQDKGADIAKKQADANLHNTQAQVAKHEMGATPYNKEVANSNLKYLENARNDKKKNEALADTIDEFTAAIEEAKKQGAAGATPEAYLTRKFQKILGTDKDTTLAEMLKQIYFNRVKEVGGSNPSGFELKVALDTMPSIDKNPDAVIYALKRDKQKALQELFKYDKTEKALRDSNYQMSPDDKNILKDSELEYQDFLGNHKSAYQNNAAAQNQGQAGMILMQAPDGSQRLVRPEDVEVLEGKGAKRVGQ